MNNASTLLRQLNENKKADSRVGQEPVTKTIEKKYITDDFELLVGWEMRKTVKKKIADVFRMSSH